MRTVRLKFTISAALISLTFNAYALPKQEILKLTSLTDPFLEISLDGVQTLQYKLTNYGKKAHLFKMKPMQGIRVQEINENKFCDSNVPLQPNKSCILNLLITGKEAIGLDHAGPILCDESWTWDDDAEGLASGACIQPTKEERISVQELPSNQAAFSVRIKKSIKKSSVGINDDSLKRCFASFADCTLEMFQGSDLSGVLTITNTSTVPAYGIRAYGLPTGITQDFSSCFNYPLFPGEECDLEFFPGNSHYVNAQSIQVYGSNTPQKTALLKVYAIGDPYLNGNQLFQLPTSANLNYYTAAQSDVPGTPDTWGNTDSLCVGHYDLPGSNALQKLYSASNCNGGPIPGFTCVKYWGLSSSEGAAYTVNFASGALSTTLKTDNTVRGRCVEGYRIVYV